MPSAAWVVRPTPLTAHPRRKEPPGPTGPLRAAEYSASKHLWKRLKVSTELPAECFLRDMILEVHHIGVAVNV